MNDNQALDRWRARCEYLEFQLFMLNKERSISQIREECEEWLKEKGFKYPFNDYEK